MSQKPQKRAADPRAPDTAELRVNPQLRKDLAEYEKTVATVRTALQAPTSPVSLADRVFAAIAAVGRKLPRSNPTLCNSWIHWQSTISVLRPGTFFTCRALTRIT